MVAEAATYGGQYFTTRWWTSIKTLEVLTSFRDLYSCKDIMSRKKTPTLTPSTSPTYAPSYSKICKYKKFLPIQKKFIPREPRIKKMIITLNAFYVEKN